MRLIKLHIYGFGRFQDFQMNLDSDGINVFLGVNEAGKSTMMAFIRCVLFGFPTKLQNELRFEPRLGGKYGGSLTIETEKDGIVTIERVHGKATGDVVIHFSNGLVGHESQLKEILGEMDRTIFNGVFSFGLQDLQEINKLHSDELNQFLFGVGFSGRNSILEIEKTTEKAIQHLFKPSGRKPIINNRLREVADLEEELLHKKRKVYVHEQLVNDRFHLKNELQRLTEEKQEVNHHIHYFEKAKSIIPIIYNKKMYESRLFQLPPYEPFPTDGIARFERLQEKNLEIKAELADFEVKELTIVSEVEQLIFSEDLHELEEAIASINEIAVIAEAKREEKALLAETIRYESAELKMMYEKAGLDDTKQSPIVTNFLAESQLEELVEREKRLNEKEQLIKTRLEQANTFLESKKRGLNEAKQSLLPDDKRKELEQRQAKKENQAELKQELYFIEKSIDQLSKQLKHFQLPNQKMLFFISMVAIISSLLAFYLWDLVVGAIILVLGLLLFFKRQKDQKVVAEINGELSKHNIEKQRLLAKLALEHADDTIAEMLEKDEMMRKDFFFKESAFLEAKDQYANVSELNEKLMHEQAQFQESLLEWALQYNYPQGERATYYLKLFKLMEQLRAKERIVADLKVKLKKIEDYLKHVEEVSKELSIKFNFNSVNLPPKLLVEKLIEKRKQEEAVHVNNKLLSKQLEDTRLQKLALEKKQEHYLTEINKLFIEACVTDEDSFREKGKYWLESLEISKQIRIYSSQLEALKIENVERLEELQDLEYIEARLKELEEKSSQLAETEQNLLERLAQNQIELKELEEGTSYSVSLHDFQSQKESLNGEVKKWALLRTVQAILHEAKSVYEKERQPIVIKEATKFFKKMTQGEYEKLYAPIGERRFVVERKDGLKFDPTELSQGTKEQLYLSLRLALAKVYKNHTSFPILMDDILVNFDEARRKQAISLMKEMAREHQIFFFTCHPFIAEELTSRIIYLK